MVTTSARPSMPKATPSGGEPIAKVNYALTLGNGKSVTGKTDAEGKLYLDELPPGNVKLSFPDLDDDAWAPA